MPETRVEKYKEYRREIQNSFKDSDLTTKKKTSDRVEKILNEQDKERAIRKSPANSISYDETVGAYELYEKDTDKKEISPLQKTHQRRVRYIIFASIVCTLLLAATIVTGILAFGGK